MSTVQRGGRIVPLSLGLAMLAIVIAAGLTPNTGVVQAASNCAYGQCVSSQTFPLWAVATSVGVVVLALLLALLLLRRRRRPPAAAATPAEWQGPDSGAVEGPSGPEPAYYPPAAGAPAAWEEVPPPQEAPTGPPVEGYPAETPPAAPYYEPPPEAAPPPPAEPPAAPGPGEAEPDIDSLMAELDKISGEILKRTPKKRPGDSGDTAPPDEPSG